MKLYEHPDILELLPAAEAGDAEAQYDLGQYIRDGVEGVEIPGLSEEQIYIHENHGLSRNFSSEAWQYFNKETVKWLLLAGKQGHILAQHALSEVYRWEYDDKENTSYWYGKFAESINALAQNGDTEKLLDIGREFWERWDEDFFVHAKAAQNGSAKALSELGDLYTFDADDYNDRRVNLDYGFRLKRKAIRLGDEDTWGDLCQYFRNDEFPDNIWDLTRTCGSAYSLLVLQHSEEKSISEKAKEVIGELPEPGLKKLYRYWEEFEKCTDDGDLFHGNEITVFLEKRIYYDNLYKYEKYKDYSYVKECITTTKGYRGFVEYVDYEYDILDMVYDLQWKTKAQGEDVPLWLKMPAQDGDVAFQYILGKWFTRGGCCSHRKWHRLEKGVYWLTKAAEQGHWEAIQALSEIGMNRWRIKECAEKAPIWCEKALEEIKKDPKKGSAGFLYRYLERCYRDGIGVAKDDAKADYYNAFLEKKHIQETDDYSEKMEENKRKAAEGDLEALWAVFNYYCGAKHGRNNERIAGITGNVLCSYYYVGKVERDEKTTVELGEKYAAMVPDRAGIAMSQLAYFFKGINEEKATEYYQRSFDDGFEPNRLVLVERYAKGIGTPVNIDKAESLLEDGVNKGIGSVVCMLLKWYMDGEFVPKDIRKATEILKIYLNKHFENPDTYKPIEDSYSNLGEDLLAELKQQSSHELSSMIEEMLAGKDRKKVLQILCEDYRFDYDIWMSILSEDKIFQYAKELLSVEEENDQAIEIFFDILRKRPENEDKARMVVEYYPRLKDVHVRRKNGDLVLRVAKYYHMGLGVPQDDKKAAQLYEDIANGSLDIGIDRKYAVAAAGAYRCYRDGIGVAKDEEEAREYYYLALSSVILDPWSDEFLLSYIGDAYRIGSLVVQDEKEAVFWYKEAQRCGEKLSEEAQEFMARMNGGE